MKFARSPRAERSPQVFGHIHEAYGATTDASGTLFLNASTCTLRYKATQPPLVVDVSRAEPLTRGMRI